MTSTSSITIPPATKDLPERPGLPPMLDAATVPLPHSGPVPTPQPLGPCHISEPRIASLTLPQAEPANPAPPEEYLKPATGTPGRRVTRLKMTLHSVMELNTSSDDPLTRCTFGAVYSSNPTEEDAVYGKYTPYGTLTYNVRSDIAANLVQGQAYYIDIHEAEG